VVAGWSGGPQVAGAMCGRGTHDALETHVAGCAGPRRGLKDPVWSPIHSHAFPAEGCLSSLTSYASSTYKSVVCSFLISSLAFGSNSSLAVPPRCSSFSTAELDVVSPDAERLHLERRRRLQLSQPDGPCNSSSAWEAGDEPAVLPDFTGDARSASARIPVITSISARTPRHRLLLRHDALAERA